MHAFTVSIQQTVQDFRSNTSKWESEILDLFDDVDRFLTSDGRADSGTMTATVAQDVAGLRGLVEQQTEVMTALVNALTRQSVAEPASEFDERTSDLFASKLDPFERLQQAVAAASKAS